MIYYTWIPIDAHGNPTGETARGLCSGMEQAYDYMRPFESHRTDFMPYRLCIVKDGKGYWLTAIGH
jgi:hypothetical protein